MTAPDPDPDDGVRPWERPGAVRRDCEPHRGPALLLVARGGLGLAALAAGINALEAVLLTLIPGDPAIATAGAAGLALTAAAWAVAVGVWWACGRDLALMRTGRMDPAGRAQAVGARVRAAAALAVPLVVPAGMALLAWVSSW
jgi:hypothetical protein